MNTRTGWLLILLGATLLVAGCILAVAFQGYTIFTLPVTSGRDVMASAAVAVLGFLLLLWGLWALVRGRRETSQRSTQIR